MTTNAQVVQLFTDVLTRWNEREAEFRDWQAGTAEGGPNADGRYPLTNGSGETYLVASPAKLASTVSGPAVLSQAAQVAAEAAQSASVTASTQANNSRLLSENFKNATLAARDLALLYRDQCAAAQATVASLLASTQASETNVTAMKNTVVLLHDETLDARDAAVIAKNQAQASASAAATFNPADFYSKTAADGRFVQTVNFNWATISGKPTTFAPSAHSHVIADVTGLQTALDGKQASGSYITTAGFTWAALSGKPTTFAPSAHSHVIADVTGLQTALDGKQASGSYVTTANFTWTNLTGKPTTFAPSAHSHVIADVTGLQTALDGKQASGSYVTTAGFTWAALSGKPTTFAPSAHNHVIADVTGLQTALDGKQAAGSYLTTAGGTITGNLTVNNTIAATTVSAVAFTNQASGGGYVTIEAGNAANTGYISFFNQASSRQAYIGFAPTGGTFAFQGEGAVNFAFNKPVFVAGRNILNDIDGKANASHTHVISEVTGLQSALDGKQAAGSYAAASHGHNNYLPNSGSAVVAQMAPYGLDVAATVSDTSGGYARNISIRHTLASANGAFMSAYGGGGVTEELRIGIGDPNNGYLQGNALRITTSGMSWNGVAVSLAGHTHVISEVSGLQSALDGKQPVGSYAPAAHNHTTLPNYTGTNSDSLQYWNTVNNTTLNPDTSYWYALRFGHGDADTYYSATLAINFFSDVIKFRRKGGGSDQPWQELWHTANFNPANYLPLTGGTLTGGFLNISGNTTLPYVDLLTTGVTGGRNYRIRSGIVGVANGGFSIRDQTSGTNVFAISDTGNVGIGTSTPGYKLQVAGRVKTGDIVTSRGDGSGVIYLNEAETRYLYFDGSKYNLQGAELNVNGVDIMSTLVGKAQASGNNNMTGSNYFNSAGNTGTSVEPGLQAATNGSATDGAWMSFHRRGQYALNMGLDSDNVFRIGGWSAPAGLMTMDMAGRATFKSSVTAGSEGFYQDAFVSNARNPIWRFKNADAFGLSYFQGSAGEGAVDVVGIHMGTATSGSSQLAVYQDGRLRSNGLGVAKWTTSGQTQANMTVSTAAPSGGSDGDVWYKVAT